MLCLKHTPDGMCGPHITPGLHAILLLATRAQLLHLQELQQHFVHQG
jgi:hypothetical protein